jgi:2-methylcitrate dehydratase PrpD
MLRAYVVGFEVWGELISRESGNYQRKGWHPTGVFGALGAAAACAALRGLDAERASNALGIAASQASGVMANLGFMTKPMHAGKAAACGLIAARLAAEGMTAAPDALEHEQGYLHALSPGSNPDVTKAPDLPPARWRLIDHGLAIKQYPVCYRAHRAIDGMLGLVRKEKLTVADVKHVTVRFSKSHSVILKNHLPLTAIDAKFSIEFALACALAKNRVGLRDLVDEFVAGEEIQRLVRLVSVEIEPEEQAGSSGYAPFDLVRVEVAGGRMLQSEQVRFAKGDPQAPLTREELGAKFGDCVGWSGTSLNAPALFGALNGLERQTSVEKMIDG